MAEASRLQKLVDSAVKNREWTDFDAHLSSFNSCSVKLAEMEKEREELFGEADTSSFYTLCLCYTPQQRSELTEIYRSLKLEALKVRLANNALLMYLDEIRSTMAGFFELAFPDRGGKMYTPSGVPVSHDMRSMVLNKSM